MAAAASSNLAPPQVMAAAATSNLAPPQVKIGVRVSCMNLGGAAETFMRNEKDEELHKDRLPREVNELLKGHDICGLTEINAYWFQWLMAAYAFAEPTMKYRAIHDEEDCAII